MLARVTAYKRRTPDAAIPTGVNDAARAETGKRHHGRRDLRVLMELREPDPA
jgi:hypothetical protein